MPMKGPNVTKVKMGQKSYSRNVIEPTYIATLQNAQRDVNFQDRADKIREACRDERQDLQINAVPTNAYPQSGQGGRGPGWKRLSVAIDSGAAETVIPHTLVPDHPIVETDASRGGLNYSSAAGDPIPNLGEQKLSLMTQEGTVRAMTFQAAPVDRPLGSVKRMCNSGHMVVFDEEGSYVYNKTSGELNWLREENGNYMLDTWVAPGFRRQR